MAKPKKPTKDKPPQVTEDETRDDLPEVSKVEASSETPPDEIKDIAADADTVASEIAEDPQIEKPAETVEAADDIDERTEGFVWADTVETHEPDTDDTRLGDDTLENASTPAEESLPGDTVELAADPEPDPQPEPETQVEDSPPPQPVPPQPRASFWPAVFGGIVAALLGFIAGRGDMLDAYLPRANAPEPVDLTPLTTEIAGLSDRLTTLETAEAPEMPEVPDVSAELGDVSQSLASIETSLQTLTARLDAVEARPAVEPVAPPPDNSEELAALQSSIDELEARLAEEDARASAEAERILARAALTRVVTAVESGEAFEPALGALEEVTPVEVPDALRSAALEGVPTVAALRESFPEAARAGLAAARAEVPESEVQGIGGFLRRQLSARSVTPREGSDPDAVLSRAEAALQAGDLDTALAETDALPDASKAAMQDWLAGATARKAAGDAAKALSDSLTVN